jgi:fibronectin-binding autotransporter adhesin
MKRKISKAIFQFLFGFSALILFNSGLFATKFYSYQSGNWNGANVWTTDSTGSTLVGSAIPASNDFVCILTGRVITVTANIYTTGHVVTVTVGAVLDLVDKTIPTIILNGNGLIRTSRVNAGVAVLPTISAGTFLSLEGGTVEYYAATGSFYIDDNIATYCNLNINLGSVGQVMTVRRNLNIFGSMTITEGTFQINDASTTKRTIVINGNLTVESSGKITTGTGNTNTSGYSISPVNLPPGGQFHTFFNQLSIGGNFTNNGSVRFTNLTAPNYGAFANNGAVTVRFTGEANSTATLNGITDFYNLIVDKGSDQTYVLTINPSNTAYFALYGPNACRRYEGSPFSQDNPEVRKALWIKNGTLSLTGKLWIPTLAEGPVGTGNSDYPIGSAGQLWINGPDVEVYVTATDNSGYPQAPSGAQGVTTNSEQALSIYGTFRISDGYFSTRHSAGIIFWNTANSSSVVIVEGGTVNASVLRSTYTAPGKTSYVQTGGTVYLRGDETEPGEQMDVGIFNIPYPSSTFVMTGGDIIIRDCNTGSAATGNGLYLNCAPGNFSVTGGTITFETNPVNTPSIDIYSRPNLWNLNIKRLGSTGNSNVNLLYDLHVANKLTIFENATLNSGTGDFPVSVDGDFKINSGGTYTPNDNTTAFIGYGIYFLWNEGTITNGLYDLQLNKPGGSLILVASGNSYTVRNDLSITNGTFADGGKIVYVYGDVINDGLHVGAGKISLCATNGNQTISGNGLGTFQNLELNNSTGSIGTVHVSLAANITVTGVLTLANDRIFNLSSYQLTLMTLATVAGTMSNSRFITTAGAPSDGGLRRMYSDTTAFTFPVGSGANYTPATIHVRKIPDMYGSVAVTPVPVRHPFTTNATCLPYYWKVVETDFSGIKDSSVRLIFNYGILTDNVAYVPGKYNPVSWNYINNVTLVDEATNLIRFPAENSFYGEYTAGIPAAFDTLVAFYSRTDGPWNVASTWSNTGFDGDSALTIPGPSNPVFIGDGSSYFHTVTVTTGNALSGSLSIMDGSVLDVGSTTGNNFGSVAAGSTGTLRITTTSATALFPAGDFGNFVGQNGGTVEYYSGAINFTLPLTTDAPTSKPIITYYNLSLVPATGRTITLPNTNLVVFGNLSVSGASTTALARLNATSARTLTIKSNLVVNSGNLLFQNGVAQILRIEGNIIIASGAIFNVATTGTAVNNQLFIAGNITNNGTFDMCVSSTVKCDVTFTGYTDALISGRGATTDFYALTVNKGASAIPVLNVTSSAFTFSNNSAPLTLVNGTFRLTSALSVTIASMDFDIPASTCLSANGGTILVSTSADDDADIKLAGLIEVKAGAINVGNSANNINNDIEYSGAGYPTIEIRGGSLFVNGQIRRSNINALGSLIYKQSGTGNVVINGRNMRTSRAKLEVLNTGSVFNMTGGNLTIVRGGSTPYNDLYLRPESSTVTGGTIIFGNSDTENNGTANNLTLDSAIPLNSVTVDGTTNAKTLKLSVNSLNLKGNLTINATSVFNADSLTVSIGGNLTNLNTDANTGVATGGYRAGSFRQVTKFIGSSANQSITGTTGNITNFAILIINNTYSNGTITMMANSAVRVNSDLSLLHGTLADGGNIITVIGDITNSSTHSSTGTGRLLLAGSNVQYLSGDGTGKFGNLYLNASSDVRMTSVMEITGVLTFQGKILDIGNKLLVLSNTSANSVSGNSASSYIRTDGLVSDAGVMKYYPASALDFTFPVGVLGKYTPARMNVTVNSAAGTITMIPANSKHPCNTGTGTNLLAYYWHAVSSGFSGFTISQYYTYVQADVRGTESYYVGDRFYLGIWDNPASGTVNTTTNVISFLSKTFIDGDYTAGQSTEFLIVPVFYSRNATCTAPLVGNWNNVNTWSTTSHSGAAATTYPTGEPVVIATNHIVNTNGNLRTSSNVTLNGTALLDLASTVGHILGNVTGTGTIRLAPSSTTPFGYYVFPAGNMTAFTATGGGTIELSNTSTVPAKFPYLNTYNNLTLTGSGTKVMNDADITLNGVLNNMSTSNFIASGIGNLILNSDWINDGTFEHNSGSVIFNGNSTLSGSNPLVLNNITINTGKTLTGPASAAFGVAGNWIDNGIFNHNSGTVNFSGSTTISGLSTTMFNNIFITSGNTLTGKLADNFIIAGNWVNNGTFIHNGGGVIFDGVSLISGVSNTEFGDVTINSARSLTAPSSGIMSVAYDFMNDGNFVNNGGTLVFNGSLQILGGSSATLFENITVNSGSNTSIDAANQTLHGILLCDGTLNANQNLTLLSDATRTALIDGTGTGDVTGNLTMQRFLLHGFGYKYFSSPFQAADVGQFGSFMDLGAAFPTFYRYDENRIFTGWITYTDPSGILNPMSGYAVNFGPAAAPVTVAITGVVNNGTLLPVTMFNRNHPFTLGFNLIGNPYPSPIDWDSPTGWIRSSVDDALYYFDAGTTDQYTGTYSTYINGISSDGYANNIIPAMQGFFMHVSDGSYPVAGTLIFTNDVRVNNLSPYFHKKVQAETRPLLRLAARYGDGRPDGDPVVIYFDNDATPSFDKDRDALKLMNTDLLVPNLYAVVADTQNMSVCGLPYPVDSITTVPLGLSIKKKGYVVFSTRDLLNMPSNLYVYLFDNKTGVHENLVLHPEYRVYLEAGDYFNRFAVVFSNKDLRIQPGKDESYYVYSSRNRLYIYLNLPSGVIGNLKVINMVGQQVLEQPMQGNGYHEIDLNVCTGIYVVTLTSINGIYTRKVYINNQL